MKLRMKLSAWLFPLVLIISQSSCRILPVQMARVSLSERYTQSFFNKPGVIYSKEEITRILGGLLGQPNLAKLQRMQNQEIEHLQKNECEARGTVDIKMSIIPGTIRSKNDFDFYISGNGNYVILLKNSNKVFYTAFFQLIESRHRASEILNGEIQARFSQQLINAYGSTENYVSESEVEARLKIKSLDSGLFSINYKAQHEIWLHSDLIHSFIGYLKFEEPVAENAKLIDLRGLRFVRNKY